MSRTYKTLLPKLEHLDCQADWLFAWDIKLSQMKHWLTCLPVVVICAVVTAFVLMYAVVVAVIAQTFWSKLNMVDSKQSISFTSTNPIDRAQVNNDTLIVVGTAQVNRLKSSHSTVKFSNCVVLFAPLTSWQTTRRILTRLNNSSINLTGTKKQT